MPTYAAAAAVLRRELTLPNITQTLVLTRTSSRSSPVPEREKLSEFAKTGATLAIHLSINNIKNVVRDLTPHYSENCPVVVAYRVSWPDQLIIIGTLKTIVKKVKNAKIRRTALIIVGQTIEAKNFENSRLYHPNHYHILRPKKAMV